jgi:hypothetical protein
MACRLADYVVLRASPAVPLVPAGCFIFAGMRLGGSLLGDRLNVRFGSVRMDRAGAAEQGSASVIGAVAKFTALSYGGSPLGLRRLAGSLRGSA